MIEWPVIDGYPVFALEPDCDKQPPINSSVYWEGSSIGQTHKQALKFGAYRAAWQLNFVAENAKDANELLYFYLYCRGRLALAWVPSWTTEITPAQALAIGDTMRIEAIGPLDYSPVIFVHYLDVGHTHISKVTAVAAVDGQPGVEQLTLASPLPYAASKHRVMVGFVYLARFATDKIEPEWYGPVYPMTLQASFIQATDTTPAPEIA